MIKHNIYSYYSFGFNYYLLKNDYSGHKYGRLVDALRDFDEFLRENSLKVTSKLISHELSQFIKEFSEKDVEMVISADDYKRVQKCLNKSDASLDSELQLKLVFEIAKKKLDIDSLYAGGRDFLSVNALNYMTKQAYLDYQYGCRCVALQVSTAAAFHLMRTAEDCLKQLYYSYVRTNRLSADKQMWWNMVQALRNKTKLPKPNSDLLDNLDMYRRNYRNPTQHPQKNYNIEEAQNLLFSIIVLLSEIYSDPIVLKYAKKRSS